MKLRLVAGLCLLALIGGSDLSPLPALARISRTVPRSALVTVKLLKAPGLNLPGSKWEIAYDFRLLPESRLWAERSKLNGSSTEHAGDLIKRATAAKSLATPAGQTMSLQIPFDADSLAKLRAQPLEQAAIDSESKAQVFVFYAVISVHDAKLNTTVTLPISRIWDFSNFPDAQFEITVEINDAGNYKINSSSIKSKGITIQQKPK
jgi:hypothetical protein